jgi:hypothetical protein
MERINEAQAVLEQPPGGSTGSIIGDAAKVTAGA